MTTKATIQPGTLYTVEHIRNGKVLSRDTHHNLVPTEGLNHIAGVVTKGAAQVPTWYIGLFEGNYTPVPAITAAGFPAAATECTTYAPSTRVEFNEGVVTAGVVDNTANRAEFTMTANKTIYGAFMASAQAKGAVTGILISAARFGSPKAVLVDDVLRITASLEFESA
ncbi:hypothetical protein [Acidovorax sp. BL-A-41-H1]|uniref:hypothetical protein n=1 Tax=Acidovorax sp. BL-A-41-H1 TaxID=3421102 RepID=UPI003F7A49DD